MINKTLVMPPTTCFLQTDGSFHYKTQISRTAAILTTDKRVEYKFIKTYFDHINSTESEWVSLIDGVEYSQKKDIDSLAVENDCLPIVSTIILERPPKNLLYLDYYRHFNSLVNYRYKWFGIRWIPRELNRADGLFRV